ncbi:MAG: metallophosphoesterase family protein [Actinobacteria bacterium]|nr:MAG: metallophosphoesterase family protein [Actinomycetota bacterium]
MIGDAAGPVRVGVLSDTHGRLDPRVAEVFAGVDAIVHAGDVVSLDDLVALREIAPVTAVAGNCDIAGELGCVLRGVERLTLAGVSVTVVHDITDLPGWRTAPGLVIHGHTHVAEFAGEPGCMRLNPGSASRAYGDGPPTVALLTCEAGEVSAEVVRLPE